jgi:hypothetical protein
MIQVLVSSRFNDTPKSDLGGDHYDLDLRVFFRIFYCLWSINSYALPTCFPWSSPRSSSSFASSGSRNSSGKSVFIRTYTLVETNEPRIRTKVFSPFLMVQIQYSYSCVPRSISVTERKFCHPGSVPCGVCLKFFVLILRAISWQRDYLYDLIHFLMIKKLSSSEKGQIVKSFSPHQRRTPVSKKFI